jgi:hypothetical protein
MLHVFLPVELMICTKIMRGDLVHMGTSDLTFFKKIENHNSVYQKNSKQKSGCSQLFIPQTCEKLSSNAL